MCYKALLLLEFLVKHGPMVRRRAAINETAFCLCVACPTHTCCGAGLQVGSSCLLAKLLQRLST